ncbi:hypothetical protein GCM10009872_42570 [Actinopolymorpha rutila]
MVAFAVGVQLTDGRFCYLGGLFAIVGGLFALVGLTVALVSFAVALIGVALAIVGDPFPLVGFAVALVGDSFPFVGDSFTFVAFAVAFVGFVVALVAELIAFVGPARTFVGLDESEFLEPPAGLCLHAADVGPAPSFLACLIASSGRVGAFVGGLTAACGGFTFLRREEFSSLQRSPAQPCGERTRLGGSLPKAQCDPLPSGDFDRFVLPTVICGGHISNVARHGAAIPRPSLGSRWTVLRPTVTSGGFGWLRTRRVFDWADMGGRSSVRDVPRLQGMGADLSPNGGPEYDETVRQLRDREDRLRQAAARLRDQSAQEFDRCIQEWHSPDLWRDRAATLRRQDRAIAGSEREVASTLRAQAAQERIRVGEAVPVELGARELAAKDRQRVADDREAVADEREHIADRREADADEREAALNLREADLDRREKSSPEQAGTQPRSTSSGS